MLTVYNVDKKSIDKVPLNTYIKLALAAEMSGDSPYEALRAQAVAIRSYLLAKAVKNYPEHHGAMTCNDFTHCMSCKTEKSFAAINREDRERIERAVRETDGIVVLYKGEPASTFFHDCSYNYTASSKEVFGNEVPYLQAVGTSVYTPVVHTYSFTTDKLMRNLFGSTAASRREQGTMPDWSLSESVSGRVASVTICGETCTGRHFRDIFGFESTIFDMSYNPENDTFTFTVYGSGHGVGMSQSGAKAMAADGKSYRAILRHYYPGTEIASMTAGMLDFALE